MQQAIRTHWRAAAWFLERAFPDRFTRPEVSAFGTREARDLMKEILEVVNVNILDQFKARRLRKGIQRSFERYIRTADDRRRNARNFRLAMKSVEDGTELAEPVADVNSLLQPSQSQSEQDSEFDQKLTADNPFVRRTEPLGITRPVRDHAPDNLLASLGTLPPLPKDQPASNAPLTPPDFNIQ
jgi:hypothetical protein